MSKTLKTVLKQDREPFRVPRSIQETIPIKRIWEDGIFLVGNNKYSKTIRFTDINYAVASEADQMELFLAYCNMINSLEIGVTTKITTFNRSISRSTFEKNLLPKRNDDLDAFVEAHNQMLQGYAKLGSGITQSKYLTVSVVKENYEQAEVFFERVIGELKSRFLALSSQIEVLDATERLRVLHDFFHAGEEEYFCMDFHEKMRRGHSPIDTFIPDSLSLKSDHIRFGKRCARVLTLREYPTFLKDSMISELCDLNRNLMLSIDMIPIPTDEAVKEVEQRLLGVETNVTRWQQRQNQNNNFSAIVPFDLELQRKEATEFLNDLTKRNQRMLFVTVTIVHVADSKKQLDADTDALLSIARKHLCQFETLKYQQLQGLNAALPYGVRQINSLRTLTTESTAVLMPFRAQEINHAGGVYCGRSAISGNLMFVNRAMLQNGNGFIMGVSGSGKSLFAKREIYQHILRGDCDVIIIDPEREYTPIVEALHGEVIRISADSPHHINALDMSSEYEDGEKPWAIKSQFLLSFCKQLIGEITPQESTLIDRCTALVYRGYIARNYTGMVPTLKDFHKVLLKQPEPEAKDLALKIELFTEGTLDTFAKQTNVDTQNSLLCYDIRDLGKALKTVGMLVVLDSIHNRIVSNQKKGRPTYIFIDEIYLLFSDQYSSNFLFEAWKRARKYNACYTGITQDIEDMLESHNAQTMLSNSEYIVMLNQSASARKVLSSLLGISPAQLSYVTNSESGRGLLKCGGNIVPFMDRYPTDSILYPLITTKPSDLSKVIEPAPGA